jgi:hypothetical protein
MIVVIVIFERKKREKSGSNVSTCINLLIINGLSADSSSFILSYINILIISKLAYVLTFQPNFSHFSNLKILAVSQRCVFGFSQKP